MPFITNYFKFFYHVSTYVVTQKELFVNLKSLHVGHPATGCRALLGRRLGLGRSFKLTMSTILIKEAVQRRKLLEVSYSARSYSRSYAYPRVNYPFLPSTAKGHGMTSLGKVQSRRMPGPTTLPSLRTENAGNDPNVNLVPGGQGGWCGGKENNEEKETSQPKEPMTWSSSGQLLSVVCLICILNITIITSTIIVIAIITIIITTTTTVVIITITITIICVCIL